MPPLSRLLPGVVIRQSIGAALPVSATGLSEHTGGPPPSTSRGFLEKSLGNRLSNVGSIDLHGLDVGMNAVFTRERKPEWTTYPLELRRPSVNRLRSVT
jgi:hypothetical protein